jgi:hypothetical protein
MKRRVAVAILGTEMIGEVHRRAVLLAGGKLGGVMASSRAQWSRWPRHGSLMQPSKHVTCEKRLGVGLADVELAAAWRPKPGWW